MSTPVRSVVVVWYGVVSSAVWCGGPWRGGATEALCGVVWRGVVWCGAAWRGMVYCVVWYGVV